MKASAGEALTRHSETCGVGVGMGEPVTVGVGGGVGGGVALAGAGVGVPVGVGVGGGVTDERMHDGARPLWPAGWSAAAWLDPAAEGRCGAGWGAGGGKPRCGPAAAIGGGPAPDHETAQTSKMVAATKIQRDRRRVVRPRSMLHWWSWGL